MVCYNLGTVNELQMEVRTMAAIPIEQYNQQVAREARVIYLLPQETQPIKQPKLKKDGTPKKISQNK